MEPEFSDRIHKNPPLICAFIQINPTPHFNSLSLMLKSLYKSPQWSLFSSRQIEPCNLICSQVFLSLLYGLFPLNIFHKNSACICFLYVLSFYPNQPPCFYLNNVWLGIKMVKRRFSDIILIPKHSFVSIHFMCAYRWDAIMAPNIQSTSVTGFLTLCEIPRVLTE